MSSCHHVMSQQTEAKDLRTSIKCVDPNKPLHQIDVLVQKVFGIKKSLAHNEFENRLKSVFAYRSTDRGHPRVKRALKPKSVQLVSAQRKLRRNSLMMRVARCFLNAGADFRAKR
mmetsp:Transcript_41241/g.66438  ORF Transcript_41241/g.66438 Transcript_41241/m.66438 type:complete len:115 (+) Transcript_41241:1-345(+)